MSKENLNKNNGLETKKVVDESIEGGENFEKFIEKTLFDIENSTAIIPDYKGEIKKIESNVGLSDVDKIEQIKNKINLNQEISKIDTQIGDLKNRILNYFKKIVKIGFISTIGLLPLSGSGQDYSKDILINNPETIELKNQIFDQIETAYKNGVLRNTKNNVDFYSLEKDGYVIYYDMDANYDNKIDEKHTAGINYEEGNSNYVLRKSSIKDFDIVYNYKDDSLVDAKKKTYGEFLTENKIIIRSLYGKYDELVNYRGINESEKNKILEYMKNLNLNVDEIGIKENNDHILNEEKNKEKNQIEVEIQAKISYSAENILISLKNDEKFKNKKEDEFSNMIVITKGIYTLKFNSVNFEISFDDIEGNKNEMTFDVKKYCILKRARKIEKDNGELNIIDLKGKEVQEILDQVFMEIEAD